MLSRLLSELRDTKTKFRCGTLEYTKHGLVIVAIWILWGETCFTFIENAEPTLVPLILKYDLGASNTVISIFSLTITNIIAMLACPIISVKSDRYRSRFGRRIPFLALSAPFVMLFMILMGYNAEVGRFFFSLLFQQSGLSLTTVTIILLGVMVVGFQFFYLMGNSVYFYLIHDVVPEEYVGRFLAFFRAIGTGMSAVFHFFVFPYVRTHSMEILVIIGIAYFFGIAIVCLRVKEGQYPPPPPLEKAKGPWLASAKASVRTYMKECFCHKYYWYLYLATAILNAGFAASRFSIFRSLDLGLTLKELGLVGGVGTLISAILLVPAGYLVDKKHPVRLGLISLFAAAVLMPFDALFMLDLSHRGALILMIILQAVNLPVGTIYQATQMPLNMRVLPSSRFGQFCSAMNIVRAAFILVAGILAGVFVDGLRWLCQDKLGIPGDYYYRLIFLFGLPTIWIAVYLRWKVYKMWLGFGGDDNYLPPCYEEEEIKYKKEREAANSNKEEERTE